MKFYPKTSLSTCLSHIQVVTIKCLAPSPKLYWCDSGVVRAAKRQLDGLAIEEKGALFEGFIAQTLKAYRELGRLECDRISYWSAGKNSVEVDFVIHRGKELVGIEAKSGTEPDKKWLAGLIALNESVKLKRSILVYGGTRKYKHASGVEVFPVADFMREIDRL